jgi:hypothetical protein
MNKVCCNNITLLINDPKSPLEYDPAKRLYSLVSVPRAFRKQNELCVAYEIAYCPCCGTKLPQELSNEWFAIIEKEFGIPSALDEGIDNLPEEFKTDEWWRNRRL